MPGEQLRVIEGKARGGLLTVAPDVLIGRLAPDAAGRLADDPELSRRHARVWRASDGHLTIEDLGSANGTFVNDERIDAPRALDVGDVIAVGATVLEVTETPGVELVVTGGPDRGRELTVQGELLIGRDVSGQGCMRDDHAISRRHARLACNDDGELTIEDLGSANGTFVNQERVRGRHVIRSGDVVQIGATTLEFADAVRPAPRAPALLAPAVRREEHERPRSQLRPGAIFAGCRVEDVVGYGDMGVVYRADEVALQRQVALKLIRPEYSGDERFRARFRRESQVAAAIDHPNAIPIFDAGEEGGVLFIMMRFVQGTDLRALIATDGALEPLRAARIVQQVASALDAAHRRGMVHRDVKPSNVLLAREDHVYLTDFGLAKPVASGGPGTSGAALTRAGSIVAQVEYAAPEQALSQDVDARADIYSLGCVLFEALTGEPPLDGDGHADLPPALADVVRRAMAREPNDRYQSAGELGKAAVAAARQSLRPSEIFAAEESAPAEDHSATGEVTEPDRLAWAVAVAGLVIVFVGMVLALRGISTL
jgi:pSer/pThr/pTyr-binding forkhead associated (FHA) protein